MSVHALNDIPEPKRIAALPQAGNGYRVPWFVAHVDGEPEFRAADPAKLAKALYDSRCWVCGGRLGKLASFVVGPMCAINRTSSEPPSHIECALYSVRACPFLNRPAKQRRRAYMPATGAAAGVMLEYNPGVALVWSTRSYQLRNDVDGVLLRMGPATAARWYREGRPATRAEVLDAFDRGLPKLRELAEQDGPETVAELERRLAEALKLVPAE